MFSQKPDNFIDRLRRAIQTDPSIQKKLKQNDNTRLFCDLPKAFDDTLASVKADTEDLITILKNINANHTELSEHGMQLTREIDREKIIIWAKNIIAKSCNELLCPDNTIQPELLTLVKRTENNLSTRDLICAYFGTLNLYIILRLQKPGNANSIKQSVYDAFTAFINQFPQWVEAVLKDRLLGNVDCYTQPNQDDAILSNKQLLTAGSIALGLFGALLGTGLLIHKALSDIEGYDSENENSSESEEEYIKRFKRGTTP